MNSGDDSNGNFRTPAHYGSADGVRYDGPGLSRRDEQPTAAGRNGSALRRPGPISKERSEFQKQLLETELAKPRGLRIGKLRSLKAGDFSAEELAELTEFYKRKAR